MLSLSGPPRPGFASRTLARIAGLASRRRRTLAAAAVLSMPCILLLSIGGCSTGYLIHLGVGQTRLIINREPIEDILASSSLSPDERRKLRLIIAAREYAENEIGLAHTTNYTTFYDSGDSPVAWNLSAAPKDSLEPYVWHFPIVGTVPYKGFFDRELAAEEERELIAQGYDTSLRGVSAYSTLGWLSDPVFSRMLRYEEGDLANLIIHELTHATVYVPGQVPFNETLATFVGNQGALDFLVAELGPGSEAFARARDALHDERLFTQLMDQTRAELMELYASDLPREEKIRRREEVFEHARQEYRALRAQMLTDTYDGFPTRELNNAVILSFGAYHSEIDLFDAVYRELGSDLREAFAVFRACAEQNPDDPYESIRQWLRDRNVPLPTGAQRA